MYRKEASVNRALLWFVRCLQRRHEKTQRYDTQTNSNMSVGFQMLSLRGRSKPKKHFAGEALDEQESKSLVIETEMDRLRVKEEEEAEGRSRRASLQSGEDASHQKSFSFLLERRSSAEEETDVDEVPQEKSRWTGFCQSDAGAVKEVRVEERIKHQLFSGVC